MSSLWAELINIKCVVKIMPVLVRYLFLVTHMILLQLGVSMIQKAEGVILTEILVKCS